VFVPKGRLPENIGLAFHIMDLIAERREELVPGLPEASVCGLPQRSGCRIPNILFLIMFSAVSLYLIIIYLYILQRRDKMRFMRSRKKSCQ
jgi:hypothetical protein